MCMLISVWRSVVCTSLCVCVCVPLHVRAELVQRVHQLELRYGGTAATKQSAPPSIPPPCPMHTHTHTRMHTCTHRFHELVAPVLDHPPVRPVQQGQLRAGPGKGTQALVSMATGGVHSPWQGTARGATNQLVGLVGRAVDAVSQTQQQSVGGAHEAEGGRRPACVHPLCQANVLFQQHAGRCVAGKRRPHAEVELCTQRVKDRPLDTIMGGNGAKGSQGRGRISLERASGGQWSGRSGTNSSSSGDSGSGASADNSASDSHVGLLALRSTWLRYATCPSAQRRPGGDSGQVRAAAARHAAGHDAFQCPHAPKMTSKCTSAKAAPPQTSRLRRETLRRWPNIRCRHPAAPPSRRLSAAQAESSRHAPGPPAGWGGPAGAGRPW